jgi:MFS family permease
MISLSPSGHRTAYAGWFWTWFALTAAIGPMIGGECYKWLSQLHPSLFGISFTPLQILIVVSIFLASLSQIFMSRAPAPKESDNSVRQLLITLLSPGIFRAAISSFFNMPDKIEKP